MKTIKQLFPFALSLGISSIACQDNIFHSNDSARSSVVFDLTALKRSTAVGQQGDGVSVLDSLKLTIQPDGNDTQKFAKKIAEGDSKIVFDVEVKKGTTQFVASVLSNSGERIYGGSRIIEITEKGFRVDIPLTAVNPVLFVSPADFETKPGVPNYIFVSNKGVGSLSWNILKPVPIASACSDSCINFFPGSKTTLAGDTTAVLVIPAQAKFGDQFRIRIDSKFGHVDLSLTNGVMRTSKPDLVITGFKTTGPAVIGGNNQAEVPIQVVVTNIGKVAAGTFPLSAQVTTNQGIELVSFFCSSTNTPLSPGGLATTAGKVIFAPGVHNVTVDLRIMADSCCGLEFPPSYCWIDESNETNNVSSPITVVIP